MFEPLDAPADSVPAPTWLAAVLDGFERHPEADVLAGGASFVDGPVALRRSLAVARLGIYYLLRGTPTRPLSRPEGTNPLERTG